MLGYFSNIVNTGNMPFINNRFFSRLSPPLVFKVDSKLVLSSYEYSIIQSLKGTKIKKY